MHNIGPKYLQPPPIPATHIKRQIILDEIATKLLQIDNDPSKYETTITITGAGGFGKTTTVIAVCHDPIVNNSLLMALFSLNLDHKQIILASS